MAKKKKKPENKNREYLLKKLRENGGPIGLDVSNEDLRKGDFSNLNLESVNFQNCLLRGANFSGSWLEKSDFSGSNIYRANFERTSLWKSNFDDTDAKQANFSHANLMDVTFRNALLFRANFEGAFLFHAILSNTWFSRKDLGPKILFDYEYFLKFASRLDSQFDEIEIPRSITIEQWFRDLAPHPLVMAQETYLALKNNFSQIGRYDDASWAYVQERISEKNSHWPPRVYRNCYQDDYRALPKKGLKRIMGKLNFHLRHLSKYIIDWVVELTVGYGEKPLRSAIVALATIFGFSILYKFFGGIELVDPDASNSMLWCDYLNYSLGAFSTIGFSQFSAKTPLSQFLTSLEALSGISILALLMFALGNRVSRS